MTFVKQPRRSVGLAAGLALAGIIAVPLGLIHDRLSLATPALLLVLPVLIAAVLGGLGSSVVVAVVSALLFNLVFIPPVLTFQIRHPEDVLAYVVFATVAVVVGTLVSREAERRRIAERTAADISAMHSALVALTAERESLAAEAQKVAVLEEVDRQRSILLRSVSHDLRTPLVTIRAVSTDLRSEDVFDAQTRLELLDLVISEAERLDRMVTNILSLSRIDAGALVPRLDVVDLAEVIHTSVRRLRRLFEASHLDIDLPTELPLVWADQGLLDQVLTNLLENAVRHGGRNARVSAKVVIETGPSRSMVSVSVEDDGEGLDPAIRARLFEPWNSAAHGSLSGVGLAICKSIVEAQGGKISVDDNDGQGTRFSVTLAAYCPAH